MRLTLEQALLHANDGFYEMNMSLEYANPDIVDVLLRHGADPNQELPLTQFVTGIYKTPWTELLDSCWKHSSRFRGPRLDQIMISLIRHGADLSFRPEDKGEVGGTPPRTAAAMVKSLCTPMNVDLLSQTVTQACRSRSRISWANPLPWKHRETKILLEEFHSTFNKPLETRVITNI